ncbi:aldolase/citrate lyase family protein [Anderseniella sp. Alg231-50]|uniref:aldolase/citrate lyase family protein n=1 Tax=Anderseniella sp. Alg231-50 TaxID=1922226 RepID=UPI000D54E154
MTVRPRRSVLYMPGSNTRALEKAKTLAADTLILDLEDAVAPSAKAEARGFVCEAVKVGGYGRRELVIRINSLTSEWGLDDLSAAVQAGPDAILVPKVSTPFDIATVDKAMADAPETLSIWAMMETPLAMLNAREIASATSEYARFECMVMGTNDLAKETGAGLGGDRVAMLPWLMTCVAAARAYGLVIVDGVYNDFRNDEGCASECEQGRLIGMDGKTLIHPGQIAPANAAFAPSPEQIAAANDIIAAFALPENAGLGAINLNGRMVELLHCDIAKKTVAMSEAISALEAAS